MLELVKKKNNKNYRERNCGSRFTETEYGDRDINRGDNIMHDYVLYPFMARIRVDPMVSPVASTGAY